MKSGFKILDSDMHLREPADLWDKLYGARSGANGRRKF